MMPTSLERIERIELAITALAGEVFAATRFEEAKHPRKGGKFAPAPGAAAKATAQAKAAIAQSQAHAAPKASAKSQSITAQDKAKAAEKAKGAAKKGGSGKAAQEKKAEEEKKFMESRAASDKAAADKQREVDAKDGNVHPDQPDVATATDGSTVPIDPGQAAAIKDVVTSFVNEAMNEPENGDPVGAKLAAQAAQWAAAAAVKGGPILQKVQDERDAMAKIVDDKNETTQRRLQAQRIMEAYQEVLSNVDY